MNNPPCKPDGAARLPRRQLAELHQHLAGAQDEQVVRLVALVDTLRDRGGVDDVVAPFRSRLARLRPPRPLRFVRLLFTPLDPLIVPASRWRPDAPCLPRSVLPALAHAVQHTSGPEAARIDRMIAGHTTRDVAVIARIGALLWPCAAQALVRSSVPRNWAATGLPASLFRPIALNTAALLDQEPTLQALRAEADIGVPSRVPPLKSMLAQVHADRPEALEMLLALVLAQVPQAAPLLQQAGVAIGGPAAMAVPQAAERARAFLLERLDQDGGAETMVLGADLGEAAPRVRRAAMLLEVMQAEGGGRDRQVSALRQRLDAGCRARFAAGLREEFIGPLESLPPHAGDEDVTRLEEVARGLRGLGMEARRLGHPAFYDTLLRQTVAAVKAITPDAALNRADLVRLVEILAGPDEAWSMLEQETA